MRVALPCRIESAGDAEEEREKPQPNSFSCLLSALSASSAFLLLLGCRGQGLASRFEVTYLGQSEVSAAPEIAAASATTEVAAPKVASAEVGSSAEARVRNRRSAI